MILIPILKAPQPGYLKTILVKGYLISPFAAKDRPDLLKIKTAEENQEILYENV